MKFLCVLFDTTRRDHLSCYGYSRLTSPNIDAFAEDAVVFENNYGSNTPTVPYHTSLLTGKRGISTGIVSHSRTEYYHDILPLPHVLARNGYATAAVSSLWNFRNWFAGGFQYYLNPVAGARERTQTVGAGEINAMAIPWIRQNHEKDFFMYVHYWDPHEHIIWNEIENRPLVPYKPPKGYESLYTKDVSKDPLSWEYVISQYDACITYADKCFGELLETLDETGITEDTMVIIVSDHGEDLGEEHPTRPREPEVKRCYQGHGTVYEPIIHTPFIVKHSHFKKGLRVNSLVQNVDITPTIFEMCKTENPQFITKLPEGVYKSDGKSLLPLLQGETRKGYEAVFSDVGGSRAMVTKKGWKLIRNLFKKGPLVFMPSEMFNLKQDPGERYNLAMEEKETLQQLEEQMKEWLEINLKGRKDPLVTRGRGTIG